jgi:hypothetical protein
MAAFIFYSIFSRFKIINCILILYSSVKLNEIHNWVNGTDDYDGYLEISYSIEPASQILADKKIEWSHLKLIYAA